MQKSLYRRGAILITAHRACSSAVAGRNGPALRILLPQAFGHFWHLILPWAHATAIDHSAGIRFDGVGHRLFRIRHLREILRKCSCVRLGIIFDRCRLLLGVHTDRARRDRRILGGNHGHRHGKAALCRWIQADAAPSMTTAWVLGAGGLLGMALCRALRRNGTTLYSPNERFHWTNATQFAPQLETAVRAFAAIVSISERWEIYWAAGVGTMGSSNATSRSKHGFSCQQRGASPESGTDGWRWCAHRLRQFGRRATA